MRSLRDQGGQATVELAALLPALAVVALLMWQAVVAGQALWLSGAAARAAARASAVGGDADSAARAALPERLERRLRVRDRPDGGVDVTLAIPSVVGGGSVTTTTARARFVPQAR